MTAHLLQTKLNIPPRRPNLVARPRLMARLNAGRHRKLTLVSAPAGFGKSTLVSDWVAGAERPAAWLSLDEDDGDPARLATYLVAALQTITPETGHMVLSMLQAPQAPPMEATLTALVNEVATIPYHFTLVLDDYQAVRSRLVDQALAFLLAHLPPQLHLVITTREDPDVPLARYRARDQLTELRAPDLRFTHAEGADFLNRVMGLGLTAEEVAALEARTEGWIAGLQLAALSMQGHQDAAGFIASFSGGHQFVLDYLVSEVLARQSAALQAFLLHTSILDHLCGPLCDAVLRAPAPTGQDTLAYLAQANLFVVPLDNERRWYRYHHLFGDLLQQRLHHRTAAPAGEGATAVAELHRRASAWYEENDLPFEAFHHAVAANDVDRAQRIIAGGGMPLQFRGAVTPILKWLESLPRAVLDARPALWVTYASALTMTGQLVSSVEDKLQAAEAALPAGALNDQTRDLVGHIAAIRAMLAVPRNQLDTIIAQSRRALAYLHPDNLPVRTTTTWTLGYAYQLQGDRAAAGQAYTDAIAHSQASGNLMVTIAATTCLGQVQESENQLPQAADTYRRLLQLTGDPPWPAACEAYLGLARIQYQWNELDAALQHGQQSLQLAAQLVNVDTPAAGGLFVARLHLARGDTSSATAALADAEAFVDRHRFAHWRPEITAVRVLILLRQGDATTAAPLAEAHSVPLSQARVHLALGDPARALAVLAPARRQAEAKAWPDQQLQVMVLQAVAEQAHGEADRAVQTLAAALALAEPGGFIRIFLDEGPPMADLLAAAAQRGIAPPYVRRLLAAQGMESGRVAAPMAEPLTVRELDVLKLLGSELNGPAIARELMVSPNTMRTHTKNIYSKLGVHSRRAAVRRAKELNLI